MSDYLSLLSRVAPVFIIIAVGWIIRRIGWLTEKADSSLLRVIVNLLYPCLILDTLLGNRALANSGNVMLAPLVGFGTVAIGFLLSWLLAPVFGATEPRQRRTFAFVTGIYNYSYLALPIAQTRFGAETTGVLFIHNLGVELALWSVGIMVITGTFHRSGWRNLLNGPVTAILCAALLNFSGAQWWMPGVMLTAIHNLGAAAIPLGLILTGATFADHIRELSAKTRILTTAGACVLRMAILPLLMLSLAKWLPCPSELRNVILIQAAMPSAVIPVILSKHYGGDPAEALRIVLVTSALGLLTIPLCLQFGLHWVAGQ